jgi:muramoyltetrapeptide carboxypeptidase LdcA involved in peptidoglycan recycling
MNQRNSPDYSSNLDTIGADPYITAGAIAALKGLVVINAVQAIALTLPQPTPGTDDGKVLTILDITGHAHTVTVPTANGINNAHTVITFTGTAGNQVQLRAYNGQWWTTQTTQLSA